MNPVAQIALALVLSPLLAMQALWVICRAKRLPEPDGPRSGTIGTGRQLRLLVIGDSAAAGVGAAHQEQALAQQLASALAQKRQVYWALLARNGATTADAAQLLEKAATQHFDIAVAIFGVNDVKNLRREQHWRRDLTKIIARLRRNHNCSTIAFSGLPPMGRFPLLPQPMRWLLGQRAARFDRALKQVCATQNVDYHPLDMPFDPAQMACDGFHPGPKAYALWARVTATRLENRL